jgi:hypothetical protein
VEKPGDECVTRLKLAEPVFVKLWSFSLTPFERSRKRSAGKPEIFHRDEQDRTPARLLAVAEKQKTGS